MDAGWIGGIAGGVIGTAGGIVGTYFSITNTAGPRERAFMVKTCAAGWIVMTVFLGLLLALSSPYRYLLWIPYSILFPLGIRYVNRAQEAIRQAESGNRPGEAVR